MKTGFFKYLIWVNWVIHILFYWTCCQTGYFRFSPSKWNYEINRYFNLDFRLCDRMEMLMIFYLFASMSQYFIYFLVSFIIHDSNTYKYQGWPIFLSSVQNQSRNFAKEYVKGYYFCSKQASVILKKSLIFSINHSLGYSGDPNNRHLKNGTIWKEDISKSGIQMEFDYKTVIWTAVWIADN